MMAAECVSERLLGVPKRRQRGWNIKLYVLTNAGRVWWEASPDTKRQIQQVLFPNGVHFDGETFGTSRTNLVFSELAPICEPIERLVAHTGFEPVLPP